MITCDKEDRYKYLSSFINNKNLLKNKSLSGFKSHLETTLVAFSLVDLLQNNKRA